MSQKVSVTKKTFLRRAVFRTLRSQEFFFYNGDSLFLKIDPKSSVCISSGGDIGWTLDVPSSEVVQVIDDVTITCTG